MDIQIFNNGFYKEVDGSAHFTDLNNNIVSTSIEDFTNIKNPTVNDNKNIITNGVEDSYIKMPSTIVNKSEKELSVSDAVAMIDNSEANSIEVTIEASHDGLLINNSLYTAESMSNDALTYLTPYNKPLIVNHNMYSEPIGRILESSLEDSELLTDTRTIKVKCSVSDKDSMRKFVDGRYNTVSIGAKAGEIRCNLCGKHILKDNTLKFCGHWRGETYKGVKASWTLTNLTYQELSVVNSPADPYAQVRKIKINGGNSSMPTNEDAPKTGEQKETNESTTNEPTTNNSSQVEGQEANVQLVLNEMMKIIQGAGMSNDKAPTEAQKTEGEPVANEEDPVVKELKVKNEELLALDVTNKEEIAKLNARVTETQNSINEKDKSLTTLVNFNMTLLKENLTLLDNSVDASTLETLNATEIQNMITKAKEANKRKEATVENNSLAVKEEPNKMVPNKNVTNSSKFDDVTLGIWR